MTHLEHPGFFTRAGPFSLAALCEASGATAGKDADCTRVVSNIRPLERATGEEASFFDNRKYLPQLRETRAAACFVTEAAVGELPDGVVPLVTATPYQAFARALALFYPEATRPFTRMPGEAGGSAISSDARIEHGAVIEAGAMVGSGAMIGSGTRIASGAFIGANVAIGRDGYVGPNATVVHALIGDRVMIHGGVQIGQDGFGFAMGPQGHLRVPQVGRVIIQDDVDVGANSCIDRGALDDTVIGEGTKIDNLVQIAHNVRIGRHCVLAALVGISGSTELEDFVVMGGQVGTVGHVRIGQGAQIAAQSGIKSEIPAGAAYGGTPARPMKTFAREVAAVKRLAQRKPGAASGN